MSSNGAVGNMTLMTENDETTGEELRLVRLQATEDGKAVVLVDVHHRKPGIHRDVRHEITAAELIAAIRAHGAELPGEQHN